MTPTGGPFPARGDSQQGLNLRLSRQKKPHITHPRAAAPAQR
jgi:hypothetical protein